MAWSADNSKLVFGAINGSAHDIFGHDLVSGSEWKIDDSTVAGAADSDPTISPDNRTVAFARASTPPALWVTSISGANPTLLLASATSSLSHPNWSPFPSKKAFIGPGALLGSSASGFLLSQGATGFTGLLVFSATTPSSATITAPNLISTSFLLSADSITSLRYQNVYYGAPTQVIPSPQGPTKKVLVFINLRTGVITGVATLAKRNLTVAKQGTAIAYGATFGAVWDNRGRNIAPHGASEVRTDSIGNVLAVRQ